MLEGSCTFTFLHPNTISNGVQIKFAPKRSILPKNAPSFPFPSLSSQFRSIQDLPCTQVGFRHRYFGSRCGRLHKSKLHLQNPHGGHVYNGTEVPKTSTEMTSPHGTTFRRRCQRRHSGITGRETEAQGHDLLKVTVRTGLTLRFTFLPLLGSPRPGASCTISYVMLPGCAVEPGLGGWSDAASSNTLVPGSSRPGWGAPHCSGVQYVGVWGIPKVGELGVSWGALLWCPRGLWVDMRMWKPWGCPCPHPNPF